MSDMRLAMQAPTTIGIGAYHLIRPATSDTTRQRSPRKHSVSNAFRQPAGEGLALARALQTRGRRAHIFFENKLKIIGIIRSC